MKRIGIDARLYFQTGVGVYIRNLLHYLQESEIDDLEFYVYVMKSDSARITFKSPQFIKREVTSKWHSLAEQVFFLKILLGDRLDLMHFTYFSHPVLYNQPFISTIHDTILLDHKTGQASTLVPFFYNVKHLAFRLAFNHQLKNSRLIITPSETVKQQIIRLFGGQYENKIQAIHEGIDYAKMNMKANDSLANRLKKPFLLYVGNFYPHKNVANLLQAFAKIPDAIQLVLVGPNDYFLEKIKQLIEQLKLQDRVIIFPDASDADLIYLYQHGKALVHPSLSEGFGLPVIEAMYFKTPVITSNIPVFKEIAGREGTVFDPHNIDDIQEKIQSFLKQGKAAGRSLPDDFSFQKMTESMLRIYQTRP